MNTDGPDPRAELEIFRRAGITGKTDFQQHPEGIYLADGKADGVYYEIRIKECTIERCRQPYDEAPAGVSINVSTVQWYLERDLSFLFIIDCPDKQGRAFPSPCNNKLWNRAGWQAEIDPKIAQHYARGTGRDLQETGKQSVYGIPVDRFVRIY